MNVGHRLRARAVPALMVCAALAGAALAEDLGVRGATWPVAEPDLLAGIEARLGEMERSGALARIEREAQSQARARVEEPEAVSGIVPARGERVRLFDPAVVLDRDLRTADGAVIARAGTRVNPLDHHALTRSLLFIDGTRAAEVAWALAHDRPATVVLLAGRPLELTRRHGRTFFFDQGARLSGRFGIEATPTVVEQAGSKLRIVEVPVDEPEARP